MGVDVQNFYYHRTLHHELLSDLGFLNLSAAATGVYFRLRLMAAITNNSGSIQMGSIRLTFSSLISFVISTFGLSKSEAKKIVKELETSGHVSITPAGIVRLPKYLEEQFKAPSAAAAKKRAQRERGGEARSAGSLPPPGQCSVSDQFQGGDMSPYKKGTCPPITERTELITESNTSVNLNPDAETENLRAQGGQTVRSVQFSGSKRSEPGGGREPAERHADPVMMACDLVQEFDHRSVNVWKDWLSRFQSSHGHQAGEDMFIHCLNVLGQKLNSGRPIKVAPSAYLQGVMKKLLNGGHP